MKTLQDQYKLIKEGKGHKGVFLKEAKQMFPNYIRNAANFDEVSNILKDKGIISENIVGIEPINSISRPKESYEEKFEAFLAEARKKKETGPDAEVKKTTKEVEDKLKNNFDRTDKKNPDNQIFGEIMKGYYCEMKNPKNADKTEQQLRDIVLKNLAKDPIYYTKNGMFGEEGVGVELEVPGLGTPKEPKGPHKSSGYGNLNESHQPGDEVIYKGTKYTVVDEDEYVITLKDEKGNVITKNYNQFKQGEYKPSLQEQQLRKVINNIVRQELISENKKAQKAIAEIEKEAKVTEISTKLEALNTAIEERQSRLNSIEENEDMRELMDKKALKELKKEISLLEKYQKKCEKVYEKLTKTKKKEIIDEDTIDEAEGDAEDTEKMKTDLEDIKSAIDDISKTELFEEEPSEEYLEAKEKAEERYDAGEDIESIIKDFPEFEEMLFQDLKGKHEG